MIIRAFEESDWPEVLALVREVCAEGDSYPYPVDIDEPTARHYWIDVPRATYVAGGDDGLLGSYTIRPNQPSLGAHVCNCGYMVAESARGRGLGRALCMHSLDEARRLGFLAMQYNLVVATNEPAVALWRGMGFEIVGTLPLAFRHQRLGLVDAHIMYRLL